MNKKDLATRMSIDSGMAVEHCQKLIDLLVKHIEEACADGEVVMVQGFGRFSLAKVAKEGGRYRVKFTYARRKASLTPSDAVEYKKLKNVFK